MMVDPSHVGINGGSDDQCSVKVAVRVRPLTAKEQLQNCNDCVSYVPGRPEVVLDSTRGYTFDWVFSPTSAQVEVYDQSVLPVIDKFLDGYNATILAYGQTGSGKTFTMGTGLEVSQDDPDTQGIVPRAISEIFARLHHSAEKKPDFKWEVYVSFLELYNEELIDLLNPPLATGSRKVSSLTIREDGQGGIYWSGVKEEPANSPEDLINLLQKGSLCRTTGSTDMNLTSSRSHAIFSIILKQEIPPSADDPASHGSRKLHSKFNFVDLAGSERLKKTKAVGDRAKEGISINSGLLAMGKVIHALNDRAAHVPYRDSKLTRLLQDSLGGNSQTLMIACVSPADSNFGETMNTLNYASRARNIRNRVMVNEDYQAMEVHQLRAEISRLKMELMAVKSSSSSGGGGMSNGPALQAPSRLGFRTDDGMDINTGKRLRTENEGLKAECRQLELQLYHVRERIKLLRQSVETYDLVGTAQVNDPEVIAVLERYRNAVADLNAKLQYVEDELLPKKLPKSMQAHQPNLPRSVSTLSVVNDTIQRARREIQKEVKLVQRKRPDSPKFTGRKNLLESFEVQPKPSDNSDAESNYEDENNEDNFKAEDEMLSMLEQIQTDISLKEELVEQLEKTQSEYSVMREKYEEKLRQLQGNLSLIQKERDKALKRSATSDNVDEKAQVASIRSKYEDKINKLTSEINDLRRKYQEVQRKISDKRATNEALLRTMKGNIEALKVEKMKMLKKLRDRDQQIREREQEHDRELSRLRRREKQIQEHAKKLESSNQMNKLMLKRRTEEHLQAQNKLRSVMKMLKKTRPTSSPISKRMWRNQSLHMERPGSAVSHGTPPRSPHVEHPLARQLFTMDLNLSSHREQERLKMQASFKKNLIFHELNNYISGKQITELLDDLVQKRASLSEDKRELVQEKAQIDSRLASTPGIPANAELIQMLRQQSLDSQDRIAIVEAEINYYSNRIRSMQVETIKGPSLPASNDTLDISNGFENAIDMVKSLDGGEAKKMLESMIEDVISLKISDRTLQVENQQLQEESNELRRSIAAMRKAALENALEQEPTRTAVSNLATTKRSPPSKHHSPTQIRHSFNPDQSLLSEMESLERDFEQIGNDLKVFAAESNLTLPDRQQESYKSLNVFERLHRVQTVASQAKVKDHHHPQGSGSLSTRSSKDFLFDDRLFLGASSSSLLSTGLPAIGREIPPLFKPNNDPTQPHHDVMDVGELSATENVEHSADILPSVGQLQPAEFESTAAAAVAISSNDGGMEKLMSIRDAIQRAMFKKNTL